VLVNSEDRAALVRYSNRAAAVEAVKRCVVLALGNALNFSRLDGWGHENSFWRAELSKKQDEAEPVCIPYVQAYLKLIRQRKERVF
jgi:hypothetical protein